MELLANTEKGEPITIEFDMSIASIIVATKDMPKGAVYIANFSDFVYDKKIGRRRMKRSYGKNKRCWYKVNIE